MGAKPEVISVSGLRKMRDSSAKNEAFFLQIPSYQRGLVWSDEKKRNLILSMHKGFPIGSLLLYQSSEKTPDGKKTLVQIIDGLQRSTAMLDYIAKPLKFAPVADALIEKTTYLSMLRIVSPYVKNANVQTVRDAVNAWALETETVKAESGFQASDLRKRIEKHFEINFSQDDQEELEVIIAGSVIDHLSDEFDNISQYQVPVIVYTGPDENLPEIFESLNSGTPLTKYDKFGATWSNYKTITKTKAIRDAVKERFTVYLDKGWEVQNFDPTQDIPEDGLDLFEYLTGLGKVLSDRYKSLFSQVEKHSEPPATAFVLATLAHKCKTAEMGLLPSKVSNGQGIDLTKFEAALDDACKIVNEKLSEILSLKLNQRNAEDRFLPHSDNQVLSLVLRVLIEKYDTDSWKEIGKAAEIKKLVDNLQAHYVKDILNEAWRGSGDSTLFERVWTKNEATGAIGKSSYYFQRPTEADLEAALNSHHDSELLKRQTDRSNLSAKSRLLLRVLYNDIITYRDNKAVQFDIEHLNPVKAMSDLIKDQNIQEGLPISCFGNLAILPTLENIIKGKNYIGDFIKEDPTKVNVEKMDSYVLTPKSDSILAENIQSEADFIQFCSDRFVVQKNHILKNLGY